MSGVTTPDGVTWSRARSSSARTCRSNSASARSALRGESAASRPRVWVIRSAVSYVPRWLVAIGSELESPSSRRVICGAVSNPPLRITPARLGKVSDWFASRVAMRTSLRSPGTTTMPPSIRRGSTFSMLMPATTVPMASRSSSASSPRTNVASVAASRARTVGATRTASSGMAHTGVSGWWSATAAATLAQTASRASGSARFTTTPSSWACAARSSLVVTSATWPMSAGVRAPRSAETRPPSTSSTGAPRFAATLALKDSSVGLPTSV